MNGKPGGGGGRSEDCHIKVTGKLVVSLRGVNYRFWSHLGCLGGKSLYFPIRSPLGLYMKKFKKIYRDFRFNNFSFSGRLKLGLTSLNTLVSLGQLFKRSLPSV